MMITTKIVEVEMNADGGLDEKELGWCELPEVPIEKRAPQPSKDGEPAPNPMIIKIDGERYFVIGHTWDIALVRLFGQRLEPAKLVLIVQKMLPAPAAAIHVPAKPAIIIPN